MFKTRFFVAVAIAALVTPACFADYSKVSEDSEAGSDSGGSAAATNSVGSNAAGRGPGNHAGDSSGGSNSGGKIGTGCEAASPICVVGEVDPEPQTRACGACSMGTQLYARTCSSTDCTWGDFGPSGECQEGAVCQPGQETPKSVACTACGGNKTQKQTCLSNTCTWGEWTDTSSCDVSCCAALVYCNTSRATNPVPGRGTWCRKKTLACSQDDVKNDCYRLFLEKCPSTDSFEPVYYD